MRTGYLVALPPGSGKTQIVLKKIKQLANGNWQYAINSMLVLGPNAKLKKIWLREIALAFIEKRKYSPIIIRDASENKLNKMLAQYKIKLKFKTYQQIKKSRNLKVPPFVVLDEWHRFNIIDQAQLFVKEFGSPHKLSKSAKGRYGNHTFFVSATPMNPVLEQEALDLNEEPKDDDDIITESRRKALYTIMGLLGENKIENVERMPFAKAINKIRVKWINKNTDWKKPTSDQGEIDYKTCSIKELEYFKRTYDYGRNSEKKDEENGWKSKEAAWAIGLIRNTYNPNSRTYELIKNKKSNKKSFGFNYADPFVATKCGNIKDAGRWLLEIHTRVRRLIDRLLKEKVIKEDGHGKYLLTKKKCLIFCIHQGVARGLHYALSKVIIEHKKNIACSVHEFDEEEEIKFNTTDQPYILIATDKMSESIDLHGACNTIIHYELPWSPLRLLQRVGRLTRKHSNGNVNKTYVYHIIIPGSVEEERINRLLRRTWLLAKEGTWPKELFNGSEENWKKIARSLIGNGPSLHLKEETVNT